MKLNDTGL